MIDLGQLLYDLGIRGGNTSANNQYEFFKGIVWDDDTITYTQFAFFNKIGMSRYEFFKQYGNERTFYASIDDARIKDFYTFYKYAGEYLDDGPTSYWILLTGRWDDLGLWDDTARWNDGDVT